MPAGARAHLAVLERVPTPGPLVVSQHLGGEVALAQALAERRIFARRMLQHLRQAKQNQREFHVIPPSGGDRRRAEPDHAGLAMAIIPYCNPRTNPIVRGGHAGA